MDEGARQHPEASASTNEELAQAWAPAAVPAQPGAPSNVRQAPPEPTEPGRQAVFRRARDEARAALKAHRLDEARAAAGAAQAAAGSLHGKERHEAGQLALAVELEADDRPAALAAALAWRRSCGPEELEACRARALAGLARVPGAAGPALATRLREAEACLATPEPLGCAGKAERAAVAAHDDVLAARAALVRAQAEKDEGRRVALLDRLEQRCTAPGCASVRRRALALAAALASARGDRSGVARWLIRDGLVTASAVEPELRRWVRSAELDEACAKLDAAEGAGACRRLEKTISGTWSFRDFSRKKGGTGLTPAEVRTVNQHYAPLLEECLAAEARRLEPPDAREYEVSWVVRNDGRVHDAHLRSDLDGTPLAECLRGQFSDWRYPRFEGEFQNVRQRFTVTASTRAAAWH